MMVTPPSTIHDSESTSILDRATRVLSIEATALSHVTRLYQTDPHAREGLLEAVECITRSQAAGGKVIVCGVGKSGLVGRKTVATLKSLSIAASFMHAAEAAHGDLGDIREVRPIIQENTSKILTVMCSTTSYSSSRTAAKLPSCSTFFLTYLANSRL